MTRNRIGRAVASLALLAALVVGVATSSASREADPLPSWNEGAAKKALVDLVRRVTTPGTSDFVPEEERIATFDNDGTLWVEQPNYGQAFFALDRIKAMAPKHPDWKTTQPFAAVLADDRAAMEKFTEHEWAALIVTTHSGMSTDEFDALTKQWFATAKNPKFKRLFTECVYQPQLELLAYLRANGFKTFIVSGGGVEFMRGYAAKAYGIPPQQTIGSSGKVKFEMVNGKPVLMKEPAISNIDDGPGKPVNINLVIGRQPILAFGNSDGDWQMLQYADGNERPHLTLIVHHDDAAREVAYDRDSKIGHLDKAWDWAVEPGHAATRIVVSMKNDWKTIFPADANKD